MRLSTKPLLAGLLVAVVASVAATPGMKQLQAAPQSALIHSGYDPDQGLSSASAYATVGWEFTVQDNIWAVELGFFDLGQDGLNVSHDVGIWDENEQLLVSATVAQGTSAPVVGEYRYASVTPLLLEAGKTYVIGATVPVPLMDPPPFAPDYYPDSTGHVDPVLTVFDPVIELVVADRYAAIQLGDPFELVYPGQHDSPRVPIFDPDTGEVVGYLDLDATFYAPNFRFVPEPTALSLVSIGAVVLLMRSLRVGHRCGQ